MPEPTDFTDEERALFERLNIGKPGGLSMPSFIRPSEVVAQARPLAESIFADWETLKTLLGTNDGQSETLLLDRWKSMKKRKRRELLAAAWLSAAKGLPEEYRTPLPEVHRPDLAAWRRRQQTKSVAQEEWTDNERAAFMWPHINAHDLSQTTRLLLLMATSRSQAGPHAFAEADLETTHPGKACLALQPRYLNQYSMLFSGRSTPDTYGQLHSWDQLRKDNGNGNEDNDSFETRGTHPGEGLWILAIQARLYRFLVVTAETVLASGGGRQDGVAKHVVDDLYVDVPLRSLEAPYGLPITTLDLQPLLDLVFAKVCEAEDHVLALRSDAEYFRSTLVDWAVSHGKEAVSVGVVDNCIRQALAQIETWHIVYAKVQLLARKMEKHTEAVAAARNNKTVARLLPRDVLLSFYALIYHIRSFEHESIGLLQAAATSENEILALTSLKDDSTRHLFGQQILLDELEQVLRTQQDLSGDTSDSSASISPWVAHHVATLGIYTRCSTMLNRFQPWAGAYDTTIQQDRETREILTTDFQMSMERLRGLHEHTIGVHPPPSVNASGETECSFEKEELALFWEGVSRSLESSNSMSSRIKDVFARQATESKPATGPSYNATTGDRRFVRVFRALFYDAADKESNTPPAVTWLDVVGALKAAGLLAERLYASAWLFVPGPSVSSGTVTRGSGRQSGARQLQPILFYEPWTSNSTARDTKLAQSTVCLMGKRLNIAYGWDVDTLKE